MIKTNDMTAWLRGAVFKNMASLGLLQIANYLIPLLVIPIITRVLGQELFGTVSYAQNVVSYLTLLVNFGFEYSATRQIALVKEDKPKMRDLFWSVVSIKVLLLVVSFLVLWILQGCFSRVASDVRLYWYTALINIGVVFFPTWYLQGIQHMSKMALLNFCIKVLGALLVVTLVREAMDYRLYPLFLSLASVVVGLGAFVYVVWHYDLGNWCCTRSGLREVWREGLPVFVNNVFISLYTLANMTILGFYVSDAAIGAFAGAQKLIIAVNMCAVMPVSTALFPEMSRRYAEDKESGITLFRRVLIGSLCVTLLISMLVYALAPWLVGVMLGKEFMDAIRLLRQMAIIPVLVMGATILTVQGLYGRGLQRYAPWVGMILAIVCVSMNIWLIPRIGVSGAIWSWIAAEGMEMLLVGCILIRNRCSIS